MKSVLTILYFNDLFSYVLSRFFLLCGACFFGFWLASWILQRSLLESLLGDVAEFWARLGDALKVCVFLRGFAFLGPVWAGLGASWAHLCPPGFRCDPVLTSS